ncbi:MAG: protein translocase subunit SecD [Burkholderiaceae bacterium]|jgi:preprotein translocase subunit SecD
MNRYPTWKYVIIVLALFAGLLYTLPNFFKPVPAVQVASLKPTIKVDSSMTARIEDILKKDGIANTGVFFEGGLAPSVKVRLETDEAQLKAKDALQKELNPDPSDPVYIVALNLLSSSPSWLTAIHALPMYLGLDLRGGVHFLMQVDMNAAIGKRLESMAGDVRSVLRDKNIRTNGVGRSGQSLEVNLADLDTANLALPVLQQSQTDVDWKIVPEGSAFKLIGNYKPPALRLLQDNALKQNITTLHNRVNQLGTSEPVIQQQGADRIVVELPGVQDTARAKDIIGRTATLEARMVDSSAGGLAGATAGTVPFGDDRYLDPNGIPLLVKKEIVFSGDNLTDAQPNFDGQTQEPVVNLTLDAKGARVVRDVSRDNIGQRMALILFEKGKGSIITAPVIRGELGARFQISGAMTQEQAADTALLLRSGALAAPMEIIEERTVGPSLGADNIARGFLSTVYGFAAITIFMILYYVLFGLVSVIALASNLLFLVALLSALQATLTLPGMAAIALTLGMAIDSNVLINERIREELRNGTPPQGAINAGYERAFGTILDSNITTLIAGLSLLAFGSGPVRGFAVVHCLGIVTSIFSSVFVSRGIVNLIYGRRKKLAALAIGQVWKAA